MYKLTYASPRQSALPRDIAHSLPNGWQVANMSLAQVAGLHSLPDFLWLDLGANVTPDSTPWPALRNVGALQPGTNSPALIFISGAAHSLQDHQRIVDQAFSCFPHPDKVDIDMKGEPDVQAALSKFSALHRIFSQGSTWTHTVVQPIRPTEIPDATLRDESGNLSAKKVADLFGVPVTELGRWIDRKKAALSKSPSAESLQPLLQPYARISLVRRALDGGDIAFRKWLRMAHPLLENESPLHWLREGKTQEIADFVHDALTGQPT